MTIVEFDRNGNQIWNLNKTFEIDSSPMVNPFDISTKGNYFLISKYLNMNDAQEISTYNTVTGDYLNKITLQNIAQNGGVGNCKFSPDEKYIVANPGNNYDIMIFDFSKNKNQLYKTLENAGKIEFSKNGNIGFSYFDHSMTEVKIWNTTDWSLISSFNVGSLISEFAISNDGSLIATKHWSDNFIRIWSSSGELISKFSLVQNSGALKFSPDNNILFIGSTAIYLNDNNYYNRMLSGSTPHDFTSDFKNVIYLGNSYYPWPDNRGTLMILGEIEFEWELKVI